jgi:hypothetical protein
MANLIFSILSEYNGKGLAKGKKDVTSFEKSLKSLGRTLGITFGAAAIINFGKKAASAFAADQKAAKSLEIQLKNTGYQFSAPDVEYYIANLQKMYGVLDDQLRPAFQTLLTASGSLIQSQRALAVALDVSAATGRSVEEVSAALAKGFTGQTTALSRLGAGLDKATLASGDMGKILDELSRKFSGQALARLDTYSGKMDKLRVATADATEIIGKGLLDALSSLGKDKSLDKFASDLNSTATAISYLVAGVTSLVGSLNKLFNVKVGNGSALDFILRNAPVLSSYYNVGKGVSAAANAPTSNFTYGLGASAGADIARAKEAMAIKNANKLRAQENAALKAKAALQGLIDKYDVERIGLMAALNFATDEETKARIADKLAILDGNAAMAAKYLAERNAEQGLEELAAAADDAKSAFDRLAKWDPLSGLRATAADKAATTDLAALAGLLGGISTALGTKGANAVDSTNSIINGLVNPNYAGMPPAITPYDPLSSLRVTPQEAMQIRVTVDAGGDRLSQAIAESIQVATRSGYSTVPAGFL